MFIHKYFFVLGSALSMQCATSRVDGSLKWENMQNFGSLTLQHGNNFWEVFALWQPYRGFVLRKIDDEREILKTGSGSSPNYLLSDHTTYGLSQSRVTVSLGIIVPFSIRACMPLSCCYPPEDCFVQTNISNMLLTRCRIVSLSLSPLFKLTVSRDWIWVGRY